MENSCMRLDFFQRMLDCQLYFLLWSKYIVSLTYFGPVFSPPFLRLFFCEMLPAVEKQIEFSTHGKSNYQFTRGNLTCCTEFTRFIESYMVLSQKFGLLLSLVASYCFTILCKGRLYVIIKLLLLFIIIENIQALLCSFSKKKKKKFQAMREAHWNKDIDIGCY